MRYAIFHIILELEEGGWEVKQKTIHFALNFYMQKTMHLPLSFLYKKSDTLRHILYSKNNALCITFLYPKYIVSYILISNYKRTYDQIDHIDK